MRRDLKRRSGEAQAIGARQSPPPRKGKETRNRLPRRCRGPIQAMLSRHTSDGAQVIVRPAFEDRGA